MDFLHERRYQTRHPSKPPVRLGIPQLDRELDHPKARTHKLKSLCKYRLWEHHTPLLLPTLEDGHTLLAVFRASRTSCWTPSWWCRADGIEPSTRQQTGTRNSCTAFSRPQHGHERTRYGVFSKSVLIKRRTSDVTKLPTHDATRLKQHEMKDKRIVINLKDHFSISC